MAMMRKVRKRWLKRWKLGWRVSGNAWRGQASFRKGDRDGRVPPLTLGVLDSGVDSLATRYLHTHELYHFLMICDPRFVECERTYSINVTLPDNVSFNTSPIQARILQTKWKDRKGKFACYEPQLRGVISTSDFVSLMENKETNEAEVDWVKVWIPRSVCPPSLVRNVPSYPPATSHAVANSDGGTTKHDFEGSSKEGRSTNRRGGPLGAVFQAEDTVGSSSKR
jgi:hypothetical protein